MLSERQLRLLTAYVDGEMPQRQRLHVERLLRESEEARALLAKLQADSRQLIELPRVPAPVDLTGSVMAAITESRRRPQPRPQPLPRTFPAWTGWVAAAAVLLVVGLGSFLQHWQGGRDPREVAKPNEETKQPTLPENKIVQRPSTPQPRVVEKLAAPDEEPTPPRVLPDDPSRTPPVVENKQPTQPNDPVFADSSHEPPSKFERIELALPEVHRLHELKKPENLTRLTRQLDTAPGFRVELPARDAGRGFDHVKAVLKSRKVNLLIDPMATNLLKKPTGRPSYALFIENISPADLAELLAKIGAADRAAADKKASDQRFDGSLVVKSLSRWDVVELTSLLGVDPVKTRPTPAKSTSIDIRKPFSEQTAAEVADILAGKHAPRPGTTLAAQTAVVLPLVGTRTRSAEVKRFLEGRKPARPGTLQVFLVLRSLPG